MPFAQSSAAIDSKLVLETDLALKVQLRPLLIYIRSGARVRWLKHQPDLWIWRRFQPQPWVQCARVLREMGYDRQAHRILRHRERRTLFSENVSLPEKFVRGFLNLVCGHGHAMYLLMFWGALAFLFGVAVNKVAYDANLIRPTNAEILVDELYAGGGVLPPDYSSFRPIPFTFGRMLPLPPMAGRGEWAACNRRQIEAVVEKHRRSGGSYHGPCLPMTCNAAEFSWNSTAVNTCKVLVSIKPEEAAQHPSFYPILRAANISLRNEELLAHSQAGTPPTFLDVPLVFFNDAAAEAEDRLNAAFSAGRAAPWNMFVSFVGWTISVILATYAAGALKRRE